LPRRFRRGTSHNFLLACPSEALAKEDKELRDVFFIN